MKFLVDGEPSIKEVEIPSIEGLIDFIKQHNNEILITANYGISKKETGIEWAIEVNHWCGGL